MIESGITPAYPAFLMATIQQSGKHLPNLRLIYILRIPKNRAWSAALMNLNFIDMKFEQASD